MNKLYKIISIALLIIVVISMTMTVNAYTNESVISYISKAHTVNGRTVQLSGTQRESLTKYLRENPVTDSEANEIIAKLDEAKALIDNSGATDLSQLSENIKAEVVSLVKSAGAIAGLEVQIDTKSETITIKDKNGNVIIRATSYSELNKTAGSNSNANASSTTNAQGSNKNNAKPEKKLVYTGGANYVVALKSVIAIVAVAMVGMVLKNKYAK